MIYYNFVLYNIYYNNRDIINKNIRHNILQSNLLLYTINILLLYYMCKIYIIKYKKIVSFIFIRYAI
jgi:hypothetical protein